MVFCRCPSFSITYSTILDLPDDEKDRRLFTSSNNNTNLAVDNDYWSNSTTWIPIFGKDIISNLFSRDWVLRDMAIRTLSREIVSIFHAK